MAGKKKLNGDAEAQQSERVVNSKQLVSLLKSALRSESEAAEIRGDHGQLVKSAKTNGHLDPRSFKVIMQAEKIGLNKGIAARDSFLRNIRLYEDKLVEEGHWESFVGDLADQADAAAKESAEDQEDDVDLRSDAHKADEKARLEQEAAANEAVASNVTKLKRGIKTLPPEGEAPGSYSRH